MLRRIIAALVIAIFAFLKQPWQSTAKIPNNSNIYVVVSVSDGDTLIARDNNSSIHVRLIGIDAPEIHQNEKALQDSQKSGVSIKKILSLGRSSFQHLNKLLPRGSRIKLTSDRDKLDRFGRTLSYVNLEDGTFINKLMLQDGYAYQHTISPNFLFKNEFKKAANLARKNRAGLWAEIDLDRFE